MLIRVTRFKGSRARYKEVRGPNGGRYAAWKAGLGQGLDTLVDGKPTPEVIRAMRNARKQERRLAR